MEKSKDDEDRRFHQVRMTDSAGLSFVVSKNTSHIVGANQSVFMRSLLSKADRQRMFRMAFALGSTARQWRSIWIPPQSWTILDAAEEGLQRTHHQIGGRSVIRSKGFCFWWTSGSCVA